MKLIDHEFLNRRKRTRERMREKKKRVYAYKLQTIDSRLK